MISDFSGFMVLGKEENEYINSMSERVTKGNGHKHGVGTQEC